MLDPKVYCSVLAAVFFLEDLYLWVVFVFANLSPRRIGRTVIDDDDLESVGGIVEIEKGEDRAVHGRLFVPAGHDDRDLGKVGEGRKRRIKGLLELLAALKKRHEHKYLHVYRQKRDGVRHHFSHCHRDTKYHF